MKFITVLIILIFFSLSDKIIAQQLDQCLAVITGINGNVQIKRGDNGMSVKACWGTQLFKGDQVKTTDNSETTITLSNSSFIKLGPNSTITISENETSATEKSGDVKKISSAAMIDLSAFTGKRNARPESGALAGLRSNNTEKTIELTSPLNTLIKTNRPSFSWTANKSFDNYFVNLYNSKGLVWKKKVPDSAMEYPENENYLEYGESYFWYVEGEGLLENEKSESFKFSVISDVKAKEVEHQVMMIRDAFKNEQDTSSLHSVMGAYFINHGLLQDAITEFQIISNLNSDTPVPHEILGSLYNSIGNKDSAIKELQKALELSRK
ncbi:MAG: hypothetical protein V1903_02470 [Bacteroidota bacterium]